MSKRAFHPLPVIEARDETATLRVVAVDASGSRELIRSYQTPGQYVVVRVDDGGECCLSIANAPGSDRLELLIAAGGTAADAIRKVEVGETLEVSAAEGKGFPLGQDRGGHLMLLTTRSAVAPLRAVIQRQLQSPYGYASMRLVWGARADVDFPYRSEWRSWERAGVQVVRALSGPDPSWPGPHGRLPEVLRQQAELVFAGPPASTSVLLVGSREMMDGCRRVLAELGVPPDRTASNS